MIVNTEILDAYLNEKSLERMKNHWIFYSIVEGQYLIDEPELVDEQKLRDVYKILVERLNNFQPLNKCLWQKFYGNMQIPDEVRVYLIVGSPKPYDAMVRRDANCNNCIILDLIRISSYSEDISRLSEIVISLVTHEISHILTNNIYPYPKIEATLFDSLKYTVFDEGIAHLLSFKEDILSIDWYSDEMVLRRKKAYNTLIGTLKRNNTTDIEVILEKSNSGLFWEKFGAISGMFAFIDFYNENGKDMDELARLIKKGPDLLINFILNNKECNR